MMMMGLMSLGMILPLILIGVVVYALMVQQSNQKGPAPSNQTPLEALKERYARGEVTREEYEQVRRDLEG
jgi:putative membrane protein